MKYSAFFKILSIYVESAILTFFVSSVVLYVANLKKLTLIYRLATKIKSDLNFEISEYSMISKHWVANGENLQAAGLLVSVLRAPWATNRGEQFVIICFWFFDIFNGKNNYDIILFCFFTKRYSLKLLKSLKTKVVMIFFN